MALILRSTRIFNGLIGLTRHTVRLAGRNMKFNFVERQSGFNELRARFIALSPEKKENRFNLNENFEKELRQLQHDIEKRRVLKESIINIHEKLKYIGEMKDSQLILLLRCCTDVSFMCSEQERVSLALSIWESALELGTQLDEHHYNALLTVFVANNHWFSIEKFLMEMKEAQVTPGVITYKLLLRASCERGDITNVRALLEKMKYLEYSINAEDFNALILCYSKIGEIEKAHEILDVMKNRGIEPEKTSNVCLLRGYIESGNIEKFEKAFKDLYEKGVILLNNDLLEIIYTLAVNDQKSHIDMVIEKLQKTANYERLLTDFVPRLLHKNLDSLAMELLGTMDLKKKSSLFSTSVSRLILEHVARYREPCEILEICQELETRGYANATVGYALKKVLMNRPEKFSIKFLKEMQNRKLSVRPHYYWPVIVRASQDGNENLLKVCKNIPNYALQTPSTVIEFILPNYKFGKEWKADIEALSFSGVPVNFTVRYLMYHFLSCYELNEVNEIVANYPVHPGKPAHVFNLLFNELEMHPKKIELVINILYNYYHDVWVHGNMTNKEDLKEFTVTVNNYFHIAVTCFLRHIQDEEIILQMLQAMLNKKMGIFCDSRTLTLEPNPNPAVDELIKKLSDPNLKFELDDTVIQRKYKPQDFYSLKNCVLKMWDLIKEREMKKALEVGETFLEENKGTSTKSEDCGVVYRALLRRVNMTKNVTLFEKFVDLGMKLGVLSKIYPTDNITIIYGFLECNETRKAFEIFKELLMDTGRAKGCVDILVKCILSEKTEEIQQIIEFVSKARSRNHAFTYLVLAYATVGKVKEAQEILDTTDFIFLKNKFLWELKYIYKNLKPENLENILQVMKHVVDFDLTTLYKLLTQKYALGEEVSKIQQLVLEIQEKNITDPEFLKLLTKFERDLDVKELAECININLATNSRKSSKIDFLDRLFNNNTSDKI